MGNKRQDAFRLREILDLLVEPFNDPEMDYLTTDAKLHYAISPENYPIFKRKVLKPMYVHGLWWLNESQWVRYLWPGHGQVQKTGDEHDRVLATRRFDPGWCYIRHNQTYYDLEGVCVTSRWDADSKKRVGSVKEWLTCSITPIEYKKLDTFLGPVDDGCKHTEGNYDLPFEQE